MASPSGLEHWQCGLVGWLEMPPAIYKVYIQFMLKL